MPTSILHQPKKLINELGINFLYCLLFLFLSFISIKFWDKNLASFMHAKQYLVFLKLSYFTEKSPQLIVVLSLIILAFFPIDKRYASKFFAIILGIVLLYLALKLKTELKCIFGRNWPLFWLGDWAASSSPYKNHYGINFNLNSHWAGSLPSGHATFVGLLSLMMVRLYPRLKMFFYVYTTILVVCLVVLNYHFLGDCLAGISLALLVNAVFIIFLC